MTAERPAPGQVRARFFDAVRVLAQLHAIVPAEVGLGDEPAVGLADEVDRWTRAFATLPPEMAGDYERAAKALRASMPAPLPPAVNHGDFRLGNTLCEGDRVNAVIDWEIWSVGDPRVDLSWLTYFTDDAGHPAVAPGTVAGTPAGREVVRAYEDALGRPRARARLVRRAHPVQGGRHHRPAAQARAEARPAGEGIDGADAAGTAPRSSRRPSAS